MKPLNAIKLRFRECLKQLGVTFPTLSLTNENAGKDGMVGEQAARYLAEALMELRKANERTLLQNTIVKTKQTQGLSSKTPDLPISNTSGQVHGQDQLKGKKEGGIGRILVRITKTLMLSPLPAFFHSLLGQFVRTLVTLCQREEIGDRLVQITASGAEVLGWLDSRYEVSRWLGEAIAVSVVAGVKMVEIVVTEVALGIKEI